MNYVDAWPVERCSFRDNGHIIVTCEHAGNRIPPPYRYLFEEKKSLVQSHKGYDIGARSMARGLADALGVFLYASVYTRLLIDLNRNLASRNLFSTVTSALNRREKENIIERYYEPFRKTVCQQITGAIGNGKIVLHLSVHTFTPVFKGVSRHTDVGILYDPGSPLEKHLARRMGDSLANHQPDLLIRYNYPYRGIADGHATFLRKKLPMNRYAGIELEINQKYPLGAAGFWRKMKKDLTEAIQKSLSGIILT